jgi:hypothetical protein
MSPRETNKELKSLKEHRKKVTSSPKAASDFLVRAGILTSNGKRLAPEYR